ncbi:ATP-binding protein [Paracoccus pacificus]|uniref:ATP-binding protein n=1 Tax=Paracoccus pacificus TaxID=1463598 RepID=A0ABW4R6N3_9RHOB
MTLANGGPALPEAELQDLTRLFARRHGDGFGLGLHICAQIVNSVGGRMQLISPLPGQANGFMVRVTFQPVNPES